MDPVILSAIVTTSLLGSLHCAGMCGGLVAFYAGREGGRAWVRHLSYNLGRLTMYALLGAIAGLMGAGLNLAGDLVQWQQLAAVIAGLWMVGWGLHTLSAQLGWRTGPALPTSSHQAKRLAPLYRWLHRRPGFVSAAAVGLLSGLLPCGWLYLFVGTAAGAGSPWGGTLVMVAFWVGTLPAMASLGLLIRRVSGPAQRLLPLVTAGLLVAFGLYTVGTRISHMTGAAAAFERGLSETGPPATHACDEHTP